MTAQSGSGLSDQALAVIASARRAAAAERTERTTLAVEVKPLASLGDAIEPWRTLAARALEPNVFLDPAFALAAAPALGAGVQAGLVWWQSASPELIGLFPVRVEGRRYGLPLPMLSSWTHPFAPFGTPLVHRDMAEPAISAWLDHIADSASLPALMLMPYLCEDGPFAPLLDAVLAQRGSPAVSYDRHQRALLAPAGDRAGYLARSIAPKQRKELARQWRRMQERGAVAVSCSEEPTAITAALEDFFRLEASGWKGRAGTAAAADSAIRQFVARAVADLAAHKRVAIYRLTVTDTAIAACIVLYSSQHAWCWKIAYDEAYARFSPGAQLLLRVTDHLLHDPGVARVDSLATPDHPLIDHIWRERRIMSDRLMAVRSDSFVPFSVVCRLEAMRRLGRAAARTLRGR